MDEQLLITHLAKGVYKVGPRPEWLETTRKELFARIEETKPDMISADGMKLFLQRIQLWFAPVRHAFAQLAQHRALAGSAVAVLFTLMGGVTFAVSQNALPSSTLYPVKLAAESAAGSLAVTTQSQAEHTLSLAERRFWELSQLSRTTLANDASRPKPGVVANTARRYAAALSVSTETLKRLQAEGNTALAVRTAEKLEKTANAYSMLFSLLDTSGSSSPLSDFEDVKEISEEARRAAQEVLHSNEASAYVALEASAVPAPSASPALSSVPAEGSEESAAIPGIMPNVVEPLQP